MTGATTGESAGEPSGESSGEGEWERSDLVVALAHELRSPLTGVKAFVQAVLDRWDVLSDEQKKFMLTTAVVDADRLSRLITEMLDVARLDTGRLQLHRRRIDVTDMVTRVVDNATMATSTPISLTVLDGLNPVFADPDKVAQVVTNLVDNALRHGDGDVRVTVGPAADGVRIAVRDDGRGIPVEHRDRVVAKYWRDESSPGTGLGLYVVDGLLRAHGGRLEFADPEDGFEVAVTWPSDGRPSD